MINFALKIWKIACRKCEILHTLPIRGNGRLLDLNSPLNLGSLGAENIPGTFGNGVILACWKVPIYLVNLLPTGFEMMGENSKISNFAKISRIWGKLMVDIIFLPSKLHVGPKNKKYFSNTSRHCAAVTGLDQDPGFLTDPYLG